MQKFFSYSIFLLPLGLIMSAASISSCNQVRTREPKAADSLLLFTGNSKYYYNLREPDRNYLLPPELDEVSALSYWKQGHLLMVDDETGSVFTYDLNKEELVGELNFTEPGDFEGVEAVGENVYALRSDGNLYKMKYSTAKSAASQLFDTPLEDDNNTEGLGYDPERSLLLIACKAEAEYDENEEVDGRAIYGFDVETEEMLKEPVFTISAQDMENYFEEVKGGDYDDDRFHFRPSAIAYHPIEKTFYVLAYEGQLVLILNRKGEIIGSYPVPGEVLAQPEGICFSPDGDMYISSEGRGSRGYVLHFRMRKS